MEAGTLGEETSARCAVDDACGPAAAFVLADAAQLRADPEGETPAHGVVGPAASRSQAPSVSDVRLRWRTGANPKAQRRSRCRSPSECSCANHAARVRKSCERSTRSPCWSWMARSRPRWRAGVPCACGGSPPGPPHGWSRGTPTHCPGTAGRGGPGHPDRLLVDGLTLCCEDCGDLLGAHVVREAFLRPSASGGSRDPIGRRWSPGRSADVAIEGPPAVRTVACGRGPPSSHPRERGRPLPLLARRARHAASPFTSDVCVHVRREDHAAERRRVPSRSPVSSHRSTSPRM